ncbi:hypothetical protein W97_04493 [Coniosporium apollinis CBS 100218]|uniref:Centromere protein H C-terminal domain-containing protein n=1 Tax=Coniosporium apollinis (strain CBS 100218) TaxID=1168221 RepID=R7YUA9_CONA1|nr:uncharacterized protein W97_04493 [Coniosporium apollinis CBS 100218]EON65256.1 hypothetical protein W97_04493 [Coniosporium apollinis CBS 100218]
MESHTSDQRAVISEPTQQNELGDVLSLLQTKEGNTPVLSEREQLILTLFDQEEELRLESSLYETQNADDDIQAQLAVAEQELLEARAAYALRNRIVHNVLITHPVLKAVHAEPNADPAERRLLSLVHDRDVLAMLHNDTTTRLSTAAVELTKAERGNVIANEKNRELTQTLLALAEETKSEKTEVVQDPKLRSKLEGLDAQIRASRREWRTMKGITAAVIAGSGVDWARDDALRGLVMDDEEDLG